MKYHCCIDLGALIRQDSMATSFLCKYGPDDAKGLAPEAIVTQAVIRRAKGMDAWPLCSNHDAKGHCIGHDE